MRLQMRERTMARVTLGYGDAHAAWRPRRFTLGRRCASQLQRSAGSSDILSRPGAWTDRCTMWCGRGDPVLKAQLRAADDDLKQKFRFSELNAGVNRRAQGVR